MKIEDADMILEFIAILGLAIAAVVFGSIAWMLLQVIWTLITG